MISNVIEIKLSIEPIYRTALTGLKLKQNGSAQNDSAAEPFCGRTILLEFHPGKCSPIYHCDFFYCRPQDINVIEIEYPGGNN